LAREQQRHRDIKPLPSPSGGAVHRIFFWVTTSWLRLTSFLTNPDRGFGRLILRFVIILVILFLFVGITTAWTEGSGKGVLPVEVLQRVTWVCYAITQLTFLFVLVMAARRYLSRKSDSTG
jgi:hypothetical protein